MAREQSFQTKVISYLKRKGCHVIKLNQDAKTPIGEPDLIFFKEGFYGAFEVKASKNAKKRPLQEAKIKWFNENSYGKIIYPENWEETKKELEVLL